MELKYLPYSKTIFLDEFPKIPFKIIPCIMEKELSLIISYPPKDNEDALINKVSCTLLNKILDHYPFLTFKEFYNHLSESEHKIHMFFSFDDITPLTDIIKQIAKEILILYHTDEEQIKKLEFYPPVSERGTALLSIAIDIGYDPETEDYNIYHHSYFLKERLKNSIILKTLITIT